MELQTQISFKAIFSISLLYFTVSLIVPGMWLFKALIILIAVAIALIASLQLIANKDGIIFRYPYNPLTNDWEFQWRNLYLIEYIKKDGLIEARGVNDYFKIEYKDVSCGKVIRKKKRFQLKLTQQELEVLKSICEENKITLIIQEAFTR